MALFVGGDIACRRKCTTRELGPGSAPLGSFFAGERGEAVVPGAVAFCSVVPEATARLLTALDQLAPDTERVQVDHRNCPGLKISYPKPEEIGPDRLANGIAALRYGRLPAIVIDMGSAATFDIVTVDGYVGGLIAPGLSMMTRYLHEKTALLPLLDPAELPFDRPGYGRSTVDAMKIGSTVGYRGMIAAMLDSVLAELHATRDAAEIILTGGDSRLLSAWPPFARFRHEPDLTMQGLAAAVE